MAIGVAVACPVKRRPPAQVTANLQAPARQARSRARLSTSESVRAGAGCPVGALRTSGELAPSTRRKLPVVPSKIESEPAEVPLSLGLSHDNLRCVRSIVVLDGPVGLTRRPMPWPKAVDPKDRAVSANPCIGHRLRQAEFDTREPAQRLQRRFRTWVRQVDNPLRTDDSRPVPHVARSFHNVRSGPLRRVHDNQAGCQWGPSCHVDCGPRAADDVRIPELSPMVGRDVGNQKAPGRCRTGAAPWNLRPYH